MITITYILTIPHRITKSCKPFTNLAQIAKYDFRSPKIPPIYLALIISRDQGKDISTSHHSYSINLVSMITIPEDIAAST